MVLAVTFAILILTILVILFTAELAVRHSVKIAHYFSLSDELIGMTILAIGTSIPEIITHVVGSIKILADNNLMDEVSSLVIGTNLGSDIFQQNFLLGIIAFFGIVYMQKKYILKNVGGLIAAALLLLIFSFNGYISRTEGLVLVLIYFVYLFMLKKYDLVEEVDLDAKKNNIAKNIFYVVFSFIAMTIAANYLVDSSVVIVEMLDISASFFGVISLGIATAFPELITSIIALVKKRAKISAGVLIGSNITNPLFALGLGGLISSYTVPNSVIFFDLPFKIATAFLIYLFMRKGKLTRLQATTLILAYFAYLYIRTIYFPIDIFI